MSKVCPQCDLINPQQAQRCECGYDFDSSASSSIEGNFKFTAEQKKTIASLSTYLTIVGVATFFWGVVLIVASSTRFAQVGITPLVQGFLLLFIGAYTCQASAAFRRITHTQGQDFYHLIRALMTLKTWSQLQVALLCVWLAGAVLVLLLLAPFRP